MEVDEKHVNDLPDEVLEYILSVVSSYKDHDQCRLVCKRWYHLSKSVCQLSKSNLHRSIKNSTIVWKTVPTQKIPQPITKRYSHSSCYKGCYLYVFGGCTSTCTTFNDLWTLDLNTRQWVRPLTAGTYPSPKASATLVNYKNILVLFGGWTHPSPYPLHQALKLFNELNTYDIVSNRWSLMHFTNSPPPIAGHSATVQGDRMVVFGGLQKTLALAEYTSSNDIWSLNLKNYTWTKETATYIRPSPRYGQSQITLDDHNMLIIGGCGGLHLVLEDIWLLTIADNKWVWNPIDIINQQWAAPHIWCHPATKVDDLVVIFSKSPTAHAIEPLYTSCCTMRKPPQPPSPPLGIPPDVIARQAVNSPNIVMKDVNSNGQHGSLNKNSFKDSNLQSTLNVPSTSKSGISESEPGPSHFPEKRKSPNEMPGTSSSDDLDLPMAAFRNARKQVSKNRQKQLESLNKMEEKYKNLKTEKKNKPDKPISPPGGGSSRGNQLCMYALDISNVIRKHEVTWLKPSVTPHAPRDTILHSVTLGRGEIMIFGGIQKDANSGIFQTPSTLSAVTNSLHFVTSPQDII